MELETLFSEQKWNILKSLSYEKLSPLQLAEKLNTSIANISQQLRLLEASNLVKTERVQSRDRGKPRKLFSLTHNYAYLISTMDNFADKRLLELTPYHKTILKIWFIPNPDVHYHVEKLYWKVEPYLDQIKSIVVRPLGVPSNGAEIILISAKHKELDKKLSLAKKNKTQVINVSTLSEDNAADLIKHKKAPFTSMEELFVIYDPDKMLSSDIKK